jgi:hypothetical protein
MTQALRTRIDKILERKPSRRGIHLRPKDRQSNLSNSIGHPAGGASANSDGIERGKSRATPH